MSLVERHSGISLWRQIADQIRVAIGTGEFDGQETLPGEIALAKRFDVNRHTVRNAIAALTREGVLRVEQGRGTFIERRERLRYPVGRRTRFSEGLARQMRQRGGRLKEHRVEAATDPVAKALNLETGSPVARFETVSSADGVPISASTSWVDAVRFADFADTFKRLRSVTATFKSCGIDDYVRVSTRISARHASPEMLTDLQLSPGAIVLVTEAINTELDGTPLQYAITSFAADRVEIDIDHSAGQFGV